MVTSRSAAERQASEGAEEEVPAGAEPTPEESAPEPGVAPDGNLVDI